MPTARRFLMAATDQFGRIYAIGGGSPAGFRNTVERYDPAAGTWTAVAPLPAPLCCGGAATGLDGRIYVFGGFNAGGQFASVEAYDPTTDSWESVASLPAPLAGKPGATAALNGSLYLIGGITDVNTIATVSRYDVSSGTWSSVTSMPTARRFLDAVTGRGGQIYALGGTTGSVGFPGTQELALVERYDPNSDTWVTGTPMSTPRGALAAAVSQGGIIFAIGGFDGTSALSSVEAFTPGPLDVATGSPGGVAELGGGSALR